MKHLRQLFIALLLLFSVAVNAHDFEVDGIYYNITSSTNKTVEVTYKGSSYLMGNFETWPHGGCHMPKDPDFPVHS